MISAAAWWSICGLLATLVGVFMLYRYGMPFRVRKEPGEATWISNVRDPEREVLDRKYGGLGRAGLVLIMVGTVAQIVGAYLGG